MTKKIDELIALCEYRPPSREIWQNGVLVDKIELGDNTDFIIAAREWFPRLLKAVNTMPYWVLTIKEDFECIYCRQTCYHTEGKIQHKPDCIALLLGLTEAKE